MRIAATSRILILCSCILWIAIPPQLTCQAQFPGGGTGSAAPTALGTAEQLPLFATRQNVFAIPFSVDRRVTQPVEVHLFVSTDQGNSWQLSSREPPTARQFNFRARGDGEYWFASRTVDANQRATNQDALKPELRVVVDTTSPKLEFTAQALEGGEILVRWQAIDQYLLATSLKVEYQEAVGQPWKLVDVRHPDPEALRSRYDGQTQWRADTRSSALNVRVEVRDRAGNLAVLSRRVVLPAAALNSLSGGAIPNARLADPFNRLGQASAGAVPWPSDNAPSGNALSDNAPNDNALSDNAPSGNAPSRNAPSDNSSSVNESLAATPPQSAASQPATTQPPAMTPTPPLDSPLPPTVQPSPLPPVDTVQNQFASTRTENGPSTNPLPAEPSNVPANTPGQSTLPAGERPQLTNARRFQLDYDITAVGPEGVAEVQLWATADGGNSWRMWGTDDDRQSPFEIVAEQEGVFGFHVVVVGGNGLVGRRPRSGDLPDVWVGVDTTPPTAKLTGAVYGEGPHIGKLFLRWEADDSNLGDRPVTLQFSENAEGPWTVIASGLPNSGEYGWPADARLPDRVYLRLEVRDEAGNTAVDQLNEPVELEGLAPKARIRSILPLHDLDREAFRQPRRK